MKTFHLRRFVLLSIIVHLLLLWLLRFLPQYEPVVEAPVAIRMLNAPSLSDLQALPPAPDPARPKPQPERQALKKTPPPAPQKKGGILAELPKPLREERPQDARIVSKYDSKAQDIGEGPARARKPSGQTPRVLPPELALPERYSQSRPKTPKQTTTMTPPPAPQSPPLDRPLPQLQARRPPVPRPDNQLKETQRSRTKGTLPEPMRDKQAPQLAPTPELRQFPITDQQELRMVKRDQPTSEKQQTTSPKQNPLAEHFARLEKRQPLLTPTFDAPGVYQHGPERAGEGHEVTGGGKFRSIDAYGLKHFSYLIGVKRKIELLFSVPFFMQNRGSVGVPIVGFTIRRNGVLSEAILLRSSGYAVLDKALLDAVRRAAPYSPFPKHLADPEISIRVFATVS